MENPKKENGRKPYKKPTATKITPEEAKLKLLKSADKGDQGAREMLEMIFPNRQKKLSKQKKAT
jgi:hypothetical protein